MATLVARMGLLALVVRVVEPLGCGAAAFLSYASDADVTLAF